MSRYSCGFLFDSSFELVVLVKKNRPLWQAGFWNGVGGHIENNETPYNAVVREFNEEAGLSITNWNQFCVLRGLNYEVNFYYSTMDADKIVNIKTLTDEEIGVWSILATNSPYFKLIDDAKWLIPMAIMHAKTMKTDVFNISVEPMKKSPQGWHYGF